MWRFTIEGDRYTRYVFEPGEEKLVEKAKEIGIDVIPFETPNPNVNIAGVMLVQTRHVKQIENLEALAKEKGYPITDVVEFPTTGIVYVA